MNLQDMTWTCHICNEERPDSLIGVLVKPIFVGGNKVGTQNIRYCLDKPACLDGARQFSFLPSTKEESMNETPAQRD